MMIRRIWWFLIAWYRDVPTCSDCGRPKIERPHGYRCRPCFEAWEARLRAKGKHSGPDR